MSLGVSNPVWFKKLFLTIEYGVPAVKKFSVRAFLTIVAIGTNIFSDIGASYVDFFGGRSTSYEKKMQEMYKRVTETLKQRAQAIHEA